MLGAMKSFLSFRSILHSILVLTCISLMNCSSDPFSVYVSTNEKLLFSSNGETFTWNTGIPETETKVFGIDQTTIYLGTTNGLCVSTNGGSVFTNLAPYVGFGVTALYATTNTDKVTHTIYTGSMTGLRISRDGGLTLATKTTLNGLGSNIVKSIYVTGGNVYVGTTGGLSISTDGGTTFVNKTTSDGLGSNVINAVYVAAGKIYAGTDSGLSISSDAKTFTNKTTANGLGSNNIRDIFVLNQVLYVANTDGISLGGVSISTDSGNSFINKSKADGLPDNRVYSISGFADTFYAGTPIGMAISVDTANSFATKNLFVINDISVAPAAQ